MSDHSFPTSVEEGALDDLFCDVGPVDLAVCGVVVDSYGVSMVLQGHRMEGARPQCHLVDLFVVRVREQHKVVVVRVWEKINLFKSKTSIFIVVK